MDCASGADSERRWVALATTVGEIVGTKSRPIIGVVGGGPAGFFAAIRAAQVAAGRADVVIFEAGEPLRKVGLSGGGRCNVMHDPFNPNKSVRRITRGDPSVDPTEPFNPAYPRGGSVLCGLMSSTFGPKDMYAWFTGVGVALKVEADGRVFPQSDSSADVITALERAAEQAGVRLALKSRVRGARPRPGGGVDLTVTSSEIPIACEAVVFASGSDRNCLKLIGEALGHNIVPPVPSLFAFGLKPSRNGAAVSIFNGPDIADLAGLTLPRVGVRLEPRPGPEGDPARAAIAQLKQDPNSVRHGGLAHVGPVVFTHQGLSGPAALRLSAFAARALALAGLGTFELVLNIVAAADIKTVAQAEAALGGLRTTRPRDKAHGVCPFETDDYQPAVPRRLWRRACVAAGIDEAATWSDVSKAQLRGLAEALAASRAVVTGKAPNADEFVTSGGVDLKELDPKRGMASRLVPGVFFAGEVLDCDGVTGGFSFQICWSTGYAAGTGAAEHVLTL